MPQSDEEKELLGGSIAPEPFESYQDRFKEFFELKREGGVIEARMHFKGGVALWTYGVHNGWGKLFKAIGQDPENEVLIITGTGDKWIGPIDPAASRYALEKALRDQSAYAREMYDDWYVDGQNLLLNLIWDINIPTIAAVNGPGAGHTEFALACDLVLCTPDANFVEPHFTAGRGFVPGDGQMLVFQKLIGLRRANYIALTGKPIDADLALDWGLVNEVVPREDLLPRAWELARSFAGQDRLVRRFTRDIMRRPWKHAIDSELNLAHQFALECWAAGTADFGVLKSATDAFSPEAIAEKEKQAQKVER